MMLRRHFVQTSALGFLSLGTVQPAQANAGTRWVRVPGKAVEIAIGASGQAWILGSGRADGGQEIFRRDAKAWTRVPGGATQIAVDPAGLPWVINSDGVIFQWVNPAGWTRRGKDGAALAIGADGSVFCLTKPTTESNGGVFAWDGSKWSPVDGRGTTLAVDPKGRPWVTNAKNEIYRREDGAWKRVPGAATDIAIGANGAVWVVGTDSEKGNNSGVHLLGKGDAWTKVAGGAVRVAADPKGLPWVLNAANEIFQRT
jgi:Tectonin domain